MQPIAGKPQRLSLAVLKGCAASNVPLHVRHYCTTGARQRGG
jgi:hypothetical protein